MVSKQINILSKGKEGWPGLKDTVAAKAATLTALLPLADVMCSPQKKWDLRTPDRLCAMGSIWPLLLDLTDNRKLRKGGSHSKG